MQGLAQQNLQSAAVRMMNMPPPVPSAVSPAMLAAVPGVPGIPVVGLGTNRIVVDLQHITEQNVTAPFHTPVLLQGSHP